MNYCWRWGVMVAFYLPLIMSPTVKPSDGRELRPSDHGLTFQDAPTVTREKSPEMLSFFGGMSPNVPLPEARNMSDGWWRSGGSGGGISKGANRARRVLLVTSLVCGILGVVLLIVAAFLFLSRLKKQRSSTPPPSLALVPLPLDRH